MDLCEINLGFIGQVEELGGRCSLASRNINIGEIVLKGKNVLYSCINTLGLFLYLNVCFA